MINMIIMRSLECTFSDPNIGYEYWSVANLAVNRPLFCIELINIC